MISEKDYLTLISRLPTYEPPPKLKQNVLEQCRTSKKEVNGTQLTLSDITYRLACIGVIALLITIGLINWDIKTEKESIMAINTLKFADQLAYGTKVVFTGQK